MVRRQDWRDLVLKQAAELIVQQGQTSPAVQRIHFDADNWPRRCCVSEIPPHVSQCVRIEGMTCQAGLILL